MELKMPIKTLWNGYILTFRPAIHVKFCKLSDLSNLSFHRLPSACSKWLIVFIDSLYPSIRWVTCNQSAHMKKNSAVPWMFLLEFSFPIVAQNICRTRTKNRKSNFGEVNFWSCNHSSMTPFRAFLWCCEAEHCSNVFTFVRADCFHSNSNATLRLTRWLMTRYCGRPSKHRIDWQKFTVFQWMIAIYLIAQIVISFSMKIYTQGSIIRIPFTQFGIRSNLFCIKRNLMLSLLA